MNQNIIRGKIWGSTSTIFYKNNVKIARITIKKGGYCSTHEHLHMNNMFYVEKGKLEVLIYRKDANETIEDKTILEPGNMTYVEPLVDHCFRALEDSVAFEIYWVELNENDINRKNVGGIEK